MMQTIETVKITKLTINIGGKTIEVSMEEAKKLKDAMDEIFPAQVEPVQIHYHNEPFYVPSYEYSPYWQFSATATPGGKGMSATSATLNIAPERSIIT